MKLYILVTVEGGVNGAINRLFGKKVQVDKRANGAPFIKGDDHCISLSHKGGKMVVAVSDRPVGVDIERIVDKEAYYRIADAYFSEKIEKGDSLGFFRAWTRREAFGKMLGEGLNHEIMRMDMSPAHFEYHRQDVFFVEKFIEDYLITVAGAYQDGEVIIDGGKEDEE